MHIYIYTCIYAYIFISKHSLDLGKAIYTYTYIRTQPSNLEGAGGVRAAQTAEACTESRLEAARHAHA